MSGNIWFVAGIENGKRKGIFIAVVRALYGLKSSGAYWRAMFTEILSEMNFVPSQADPNVYRRRARNPNGEEYFELLLVYVEDVLACSHSPQEILDALALMYDLKEGSVGPPMIYLGAEINKYQVKSGKEHYRISSTRYVKNAIKMVDNLMD